MPLWPPPLATSLPLPVLKQFEDQATDRLLLSALEEYEDSGTMHKEEDAKDTKCDEDVAKAGRL